MKNARLRVFWIFFTVIAIAFIGIFIVVYNNSSVACEKYARQMYAIDFGAHDDRTPHSTILNGLYIHPLQRLKKASNMSYFQLFRNINNTRNRVLKENKSLGNVSMDEILRYLDTRLRNQSHCIKINKKTVVDFCRQYLFGKTWGYN
jgi:hypothetical protein